MTNTAPSNNSFKIFRKFAYLFSAHWVREGLQAVFILYLARHSTTTFGQFMLAINIGQIILFVAEFGLNQHLATLLARKVDFPSSILMQVTLVKSGLLTVAWLCMIGFIFSQGYSPDLRLLIIVIATGVGLEALASSYFVACQILDRQDIEGNWRTAGAVLGFGYGLIALALRANPVLIAFFKLIETGAAMLGAIFVALKRGRWKTGFKNIRLIWKTWRGGIIYTLMAVAAIFYNKINMFFLQKFAGSDGVAQYNATWQVVDGVAIMVSGVLLRRVLFPLFVKLWKTNKDEFSRLARNSAAWLIAASLPLMFVLFVESDRIIFLLFGDKYGPAATLQKYLVPTIIFAFLHNLAAYLMVSVKQERLLLAFYLLGLLVNLILCMTLIPGLPLIGTALAITLTKGIVAVMTVGYCQITLKLIPGRAVIHLLLTITAGAAFYFFTPRLLGPLAQSIGLNYGFREFAEVLAVLPVLWLALKWKKELAREAAKVK